MENYHTATIKYPIESNVMFKAVVSIYVTSDLQECLTLNIICHNRNEKKKRVVNSLCISNHSAKKEDF